METMTKGNATEAAVIKALVERGFHVLVPFGGGHAYDLVVDLDQRFARIQCKTARREGEILKFNSCSTDHGRGRAPYDGLADFFGVYYRQTEGVYLVPVLGAPKFVTSLRLAPARNNQRSGIRLAMDYEVGRWTRSELLRVLEAEATCPDLRLAA